MLTCAISFCAVPFKSKNYSVKITNYLLIGRKSPINLNYLMQSSIGDWQLSGDGTTHLC